jgi:hypothetical protein
VTEIATTVNAAPTALALNTTSVCEEVLGTSKKRRPSKFAENESANSTETINAT